MRDVISRTADRLLHTTSLSGFSVRPDVERFHAAIPVVDLVVGTVLFRRGFLARRRRGHVDLPRALEAGLDVVGLTIATRHPDLRGTFSTPHLWSLGLDARELRSDIAIVEALVRRIRAWETASDARLVALSCGDVQRLVGAEAAMDGPASGSDAGRLSYFVGVQGGHVLEGDLRNVERLHALGVRTLAPAHVMDNALVGSNTGSRRGGLTGYGREAIAEIERVGIVVDLAHMSSDGIHDTVPLLRRPFVLSHTGFRELSGRRSWRRYSPANRNVSTDDARLVAAAGGVVGITLSSALLGGEDLDTLRGTFAYAMRMFGERHVAVGSDLDGGLRAIVDVTGSPALTQLLLDECGRDATTAVMGGNALRVLESSLC